MSANNRYGEEIISELGNLLSGKAEEETLSVLANQFMDRIAFSTSLGLEDQVITHMIYSNNIPIKIFTIDTGRLFPETYKVLHDTNEYYDKKIEVYFPRNKSIEKMINEKGPFSFYNTIEDRKECCSLRKVEPLNRALAGMQCWVTGIRAEQSKNRLLMEQFEWDGTT